MTDAVSAIASQARRSWAWMLALGILLILGGIACLGHPLAGGLAIAVIAGWVLLLAGVMHFMSAFAAPGFGQMILRLLLATVYIVAGAWLMFAPGEGLATLTLVLGIALIMDGVFTLVHAFSLPSFFGKGMMFLSAAFSIIAGILIWSHWPESSELVIGIILGVRMLMAGLSFVWLALAAKKL